MKLEEIIGAISALSGAELSRVRRAIEQRCEQQHIKQSTVVQRRNYESGILQLESLARLASLDFSPCPAWGIPHNTNNGSGVR